MVMQTFKHCLSPTPWDLFSTIGALHAFCIRSSPLALDPCFKFWSNEKKVSMFWRWQTKCLSVLKSKKKGFVGQMLSSIDTRWVNANAEKKCQTIEKYPKKVYFDAKSKTSTFKRPTHRYKIGYELPEKLTHRLIFISL